MEFTEQGVAKREVSISKVFVSKGRTTCHVGQVDRCQRRERQLRHYHRQCSKHAPSEEPRLSVLFLYILVFSYDSESRDGHVACLVLQPRSECAFEESEKAKQPWKRSINSRLSGGLQLEKGVSGRVGPPGKTYTRQPATSPKSLQRLVVSRLFVCLI